MSFLFPIGDMLFRSVENQIVPQTLPKTVAALADWDPRAAELPGEPVFAALHDDLIVAVEAKTSTRLGQRLNYEYSGISSLMRGVARDLKKMDPAQPFKDQFIAADKKWGDLAVWQTIKLFSGNYTSGYLLNALDLQLTPDGIAGRSRAAERDLREALPAHRGDEPRRSPAAACCSAIRSPTCSRACRCAPRTSC